ncbi:MAG: HPr kinase/phosphatase C-terminal domain-containing protein [Rhodospirillales bacterium]|nr:HPr kinase/phosphatase C-terminal domain-containing protein [Rhodospirillales bacterium]
MSNDIAKQVHATCVSFYGAGLIIRGPSGVGKSDLALRLIDRGARLVADDRVDLLVSDNGVIARAPETLAGLLEVRGLGILRVPVLEATVVCLVVDLVDHENVPRLSDRCMTDLIGMDVPAVTLDPFEASAVTKVRLALELTLGRIMRHDD